MSDSRRGDNEPEEYVFDYMMDDWSMRKPSGVEERKERMIADERAATLIKDVRGPGGSRLSRRESNYKWESWGFAMTNRIEGFGDSIERTSWTYYTSGNGKGQVKTEKRQSGLLTEYAYDSADRVVSVTRSGPGMLTETTTYGYARHDPSEPAHLVDARPRMVVKKLDGIECERTYYVYGELTNVVERVGAQGAAYGGANALRTVTAYYPVAEGDIRSGRVRSVRHEDGRMELYDYALEGGLWSIIETHAHEQAPEPVDGKTTHEVTVANSRGQILDVNCKLDESPLDFLGTVPVLAHLYSLRLPHLQSIPFLVRICR